MATPYEGPADFRTCGLQDLWPAEPHPTPACVCSNAANDAEAKAKLQAHRQMISLQVPLLDLHLLTMPH